MGLSQQQPQSLRLAPFVLQPRGYKETFIHKSSAQVTLKATRQAHSTRSTSATRRSRAPLVLLGYPEAVPLRSSAKCHGKAGTLLDHQPNHHTGQALLSMAGERRNWLMLEHRKLEQPRAWLSSCPHLRNEREDRAPQESASQIMGGALLSPPEWLSRTGDNVLTTVGW